MYDDNRRPDRNVKRREDRRPNPFDEKPQRFERGPRPNEGDRDRRPPRKDFDDRRPPRPKRPHVRGSQFKQVTKLFENKKEMITYVNDLGAKGHHIDIFKIEENLYKVVVLEKNKQQEII